jgi:hypothetical protein
VVVFGDHIPDQDWHPTADGGIFGVDLQANYVAAILDQRYYIPLLSSGEELFVVGAVLLVMHIAFVKLKPIWRTFLIALAAWLGCVGISFIVLSFTGYLLTLWVQGITLSTIVVTWLHHSTVELEELGDKDETPEAEVKPENNTVKPANVEVPKAEAPKAEAPKPTEEGSASPATAGK